VTKGFNLYVPQFQVSSAYTKGAMTKIGSTYPVLPYWIAARYLWCLRSTKVTHLRSLLFRQPDGVNCVVGRVHLAIIAKLSQNRVVQLVYYWC